MADSDAVLECQDCGTVLRVLTAEERRQVVDSPHAFVRWCGACVRSRRQSAGLGYGHR